MNRILSYLILSVSIFWALPSCVEAGDDDGIIEDEYRELEIIDRALLPQILSQEWLLKGAGYTKPIIYENNFYFEDKAEMPLKSIKGDNDNGLTFTFTKTYRRHSPHCSMKSPAATRKKSSTNRHTNSAATGIRSPD